MEDLHQLALTSLTSELTTRLPAPPPNVTYDVSLHPLRLTPSGLGHYVGQHDDPVAGLHGVRVTAAAVITVSVADPAALNQAVSQLTTALLVQDPAALRLAGIFRWHIAAVEPSPAGDSARDIRLDILYDFVRLPEAGEDIIDVIPINLTLG